jgi:hypothetical protein
MTPVALFNPELLTGEVLVPIGRFDLAFEVMQAGRTLLIIRHDPF